MFGTALWGAMLMCSLIKSGTDFRDLSSATLVLSPPNDGAVRRRLITSMTGQHHYVVPSSPGSPQMDQLVKSLLADVTQALSQPVCYTLTPFDARSEVVRTRESALGNWVADVLLHAYDESLAEGSRIEFEKEQDDGQPRDATGADAVIICGGTLRGDSQYGPGLITLADILGEWRHSFSLQQKSSPLMTQLYAWSSKARPSGMSWRAL